MSKKKAMIRWLLLDENDVQWGEALDSKKTMLEMEQPKYPGCRLVKFIEVLPRTKRKRR